MTTVSSKMMSLLLLLGCFVVATVIANEEGEKFVRTEPLPFLDQLFPSQTLDTAWEYEPLLSRASLNDDTCSGNNTIPTVYIPVNDEKALTRQERLAFAESLITADVLGSVVDRLDSIDDKYEYKEDYELVKREGNKAIDYFKSKNITDKEETKLTSWKETLDIINEGYSLVMNGLHMIHSPIARMTRMLEYESGCNYATCNLYYTPADNAGFEPHWDWMDVVVVQVLGMKKWSVASETSQYLSNEYQTRYPLNQSVPRFDDFVMYPGDVLYIPRGFTHNATTPLESGEPSLHLTFGIEHQYYTTYEAWMHHALNLYAPKGMGFTVTPSEEKRECKVYWEDYLHYTLSELARIDGVEATHLMRESIPRHKAWKQLLSFRHNGATFEEALTKDYNEILDTILELADANETQTFLKELQHFGVDKNEKFAFVGIFAKHVEKSVTCLYGAQVNETEFNATVKEFVDFARANQDAAMESLERKQARKLKSARRDDNSWLMATWGNTAECDDKYPLALRYGDGSQDCQQ